MRFHSPNYQVYNRRIPPEGEKKDVQVYIFSLPFCYIKNSKQNLQLNLAQHPLRLTNHVHECATINQVYLEVCNYGIELLFQNCNLPLVGPALVPYIA